MGSARLLVEAWHRPSEVIRPPEISGFDSQQMFLLFVVHFYSKCWNKCGLLIVLRLTKSGIEYVILEGSSLFPLSEADSRF